MNTQLKNVLITSVAVLSLVTALAAHAADADAPKSKDVRTAKARAVSLRRQQWDLGLAIAAQGDAALAQIRADSRAQISHWEAPALPAPEAKVKR